MEALQARRGEEPAGPEELGTAATQPSATTSHVSIMELTRFGVNNNDLKKMVDAGFSTVGSLVMTNKKVKGEVFKLGSCTRLRMI